MKETIAASMAARISLEATGAAAPRAIFNTTSGTSVSASVFFLLGQRIYILSPWEFKP